MSHFHVPEKDEEQIKPFDTETFFRLVSYLAPYKGWIVLAAAALVVSSLAQQVGPYVLGRAIDEFIDPHGVAAQLDMAQRLQGLDLYTLIFVGSLLVAWGAGYAETYAMSWAGQNAIYDLRQRLYEHLQRLSLKWFDERPDGQIMSRVTNDVQTLNDMLASQLIAIIRDVANIAIIVTIMVSMNTRLAVATFITIPPLVLVTFIYRPKILRAHRQVRRRVAQINANLQESISGVRVTKSFTREEENFRQFDDRNYDNFEATMDAERLKSVFQPSIMLVGSLGIAIVLWYGGTIIMRETIAGVQNGTLGPGVLVAFLAYVQRFNHPLRDLANIYGELQSVMASCEKIFTVMDTEPEIEDSPDAVEIPEIDGHVHYDDISFAYEDDEYVLYDIDLKVEAGQRIAYVGHTGAGKTTMINLLCRFYDPQEGRILVDGYDLRDIKRKSLREQLGIVLQDTFLFRGTVRENITYGKMDASDEEIREAARAVNAHQFISQLPDGYDTQLEERGGNLSVGQRQLISFARALLRDPRILILDEATSSVDAYTELLIQDALETLLQGRTSFIIAHRLSTIRNADLIVVLDEGRIVERGTHDELISAGGHYSDLYSRQFAFSAGDTA